MGTNSRFGFKGATFDSRLVEPGMLYVALKGEKADGNDYIPQAKERGAAKVIGGPDALAETQALAREYRRALRPRTAVVAVTGSAGKTTTKELLKAFLSTAGRTHATSGNFNNHLGLPMTILNCPEDADFLVVEMGTNHPGEIAALCEIAEPDAGLITNIGTAHIEFFKTRDGIAREKGTLFARLGRGAAGAPPPRGVAPFAVASKTNDKLGVLRGLSAVPLVEADPAQEWMAEALKGVLPGAHNVSNACLAFALAERYGVTREMAAGALKGFGLPGSRWRIAVKDGVKFIDDTYNASPDSMTAALDALKSTPCGGRRIAVLGDMFELGEQSDALHAKVFGHAAAIGLDAVYAVGERSSKCAATAAFPSVDAFREAMPSLLKAGDTVLLKASHAMSLGSVAPQG